MSSNKLDLDFQMLNTAQASPDIFHPPEDQSEEQKFARNEVRLRRIVLLEIGFHFHQF